MREDDSLFSRLLWAWGAFLGIAVAAHSFPDSEFYSEFKLVAGTLILLIVALGSLVIVAALGHALFSGWRRLFATAIGLRRRGL